ncbi:MAG TPA: hypothetical protein P5077_01130 [bacterium]|nr:hypothetical protein [bacterium]
MNDRRWSIVATVVALIALVLACIAIVLVHRGGPVAEEVSALQDRLDALETQIEELREQKTGEVAKVKDVFSVAAMEEQMRRLRAEVDALKKGGGAESAVAVMQSRQEEMLKGTNKAYFNTWKGVLDAGLARNGFDEEQRQRIGGDYSRLLENLEEVQLRWFRGEVDWARAMDDVKMRSIEFYDSVERTYDTDTARRVLDIAFPTPETKRFFFSGSGQ